MEKPATVYIVDDDQDAIKLIEHVVDAIGLEPRTFTSATRFLAQYDAKGPACLVLDVRMPEMSGATLQKQLAKLEHAPPTIVVSAYADTRLVVDAMRNGALNFLEKPFRMQELCENIQEAIRQDESYWRRHDEQEAAASTLAQLKPGEFQVLELVAAGKTNKMIAEELAVSVRTVENRRAKIKAKLRVNSHAQLLAILAQTALNHRTTLGA